jgi:uncharacterized protein with beta-barrel porin domain
MNIMMNSDLIANIISSNGSVTFFTSGSDIIKGEASSFLISSTSTETNLSRVYAEVDGKFLKISSREGTTEPATPTIPTIPIEIKKPAKKISEKHIAIADIIDSVGDKNSGVGAIKSALDAAKTEAEAAQIINSIAPQSGNALITTTYSSVNGSVNTAQARMASLHDTRSNVSTGDFNINKNRASLAKSGISAGNDFAETGRVWTQAIKSSAKQTDTGNGDGFNSKLRGIAIGADASIGDSSDVGLSFSFSNSKIDASSSEKRTDIDTYQLNLYSGQSFGDYFLNEIVGLAINKYTSTRGITVSGETARGNYYGQTYVGRIEGGLRKSFGNFILTPSTTLTLANNRTAGYSEQGSNAGLDVKQNSTNLFEAKAGASLGYDFEISEETRIYPEIRLSYGQLLGRTDNKITSSFSGSSSSFSVPNSQLQRKTIFIGTGISLFSSDSITVSANYDIEKKKNYIAHSTSAKFKYEF